MANQPGLSHLDAVWVVMDGAPGMEAIYRIRARHRTVPTVWISNDVQFGLAGYRLRVFAFWENTCDDAQLLDMIRRCYRERGRQFDCVNL